MKLNEVGRRSEWVRVRRGGTAEGRNTKGRKHEGRTRREEYNMEKSGQGR
jgi:hypothetical protein